MLQLTKSDKTWGAGYMDDFLEQHEGMYNNAASFPEKVLYLQVLEEERTQKVRKGRIALIFSIIVSAASAAAVTMGIRDQDILLTVGGGMFGLLTAIIGTDFCVSNAKEIKDILETRQNVLEKREGITSAVMLQTIATIQPPKAQPEEKDWYKEKGKPLH